MRVEIGFENALDENEVWFILKGALDIPDEGVPIVWNYDFGRLPIGKAVNIKREQDGGITSELRFNREDDAENAQILLNNKDVQPHIFATNVKSDRHDGVREVQKATLRAVSLVVVPAGNPGSRIN